MKEQQQHCRVLKDAGNELSKQGQHQQAVELYAQAVALCPVCKKTEADRAVYLSNEAETHLQISAAAIAAAFATEEEALDNPATMYERLKEGQRKTGHACLLHKRGIGLRLEGRRSAHVEAAREHAWLALCRSTSALALDAKHSKSLKRRLRALHTLLHSCSEAPMAWGQRFFDFLEGERTVDRACGRAGTMLRREEQQDSLRHMVNSMHVSCARFLGRSPKTREAVAMPGTAGTSRVALTKSALVKAAAHAQQLHRPSALQWDARHTWLQPMSADFQFIATAGADIDTVPLAEMGQIAVHRNLRNYVRELIIRRGGRVAVRKIVGAEGAAKLPTRKLAARVMHALTLSAMMVEQRDVDEISSFEAGNRCTVFDVGIDTDLGLDDSHDARAWQKWGWEEGARRLDQRDMVTDAWVEKAWDLVAEQLLASSADQKSRDSIDHNVPPTAKFGIAVKGFIRGYADTERQ
jgi:DNA polymerase III psi subunit